ncbi:MAG TPA: LptF/LptG family permease, partial [Sphaerochaeta sp.]|nr:LptF/LptG family permease [Sphaerochaeta sp.]
SVLFLVVLSIPQFLLYTFPFASLAASSMVIGDFGANNELLALRSNGISRYRLFIPIFLLSLLISGATFLTADILVPKSAEHYRELYSEILADVPTLEIRSHGTSTFGSRSLTNRGVDESKIYDLIYLDREGERAGQVIGAKEGELSLIDLESLSYRLDLTNPIILNSNADAVWSLSQAKEATLVLHLGEESFTNPTVLPSQLSVASLRAMIATEEENLATDIERHESRIAERVRLLDASASDTEREALAADIQRLKAQPPVNFYLRYYRAELAKKYALSAACTLLVLLTFSLSLFRIKHGRLIGFGISMLVSVGYWYLLFFSQLQVFSSNLPVEGWIWLANIVVTLLGVGGLLSMRRL